MVDGKTQLFADLMIGAMDLVLVGALLVAVTIMGVLWAMKAAYGELDEPSD